MFPDRRHPTPNTSLWSGGSGPSEPQSLAHDTGECRGHWLCWGRSPLPAGGARAGPGPASRPRPSRGARNCCTAGTCTRCRSVLGSPLGLNLEAPDEAESAAHLQSLGRRQGSREQARLRGSRGWRVGGQGRVRVPLALGIMHLSLARPRPPLSPLGLDPVSLRPVAVLATPSPGHLAVLPPKQWDLSLDPASGCPADMRQHLCLSPPGPERGQGARRTAGCCSEGRHVCRPAAWRPPAALQGTRTPLACASDAYPAADRKSSRT